MSKTYGVEDLAKMAGIEVASARVMLRKVGAKKKGKVYEFAGKDEMQKIIDKAKSGSKKAPKKEVKKAAKKKTPAKKKPAAKKKAPSEENVGASA